MIERTIARISEAARFVSSDVWARYPTVPWRRIVGIGNIIRHDYDEIDDRIMWDIATEKLLPLKQAAGGHAARPRGGGLLMVALRAPQAEF